MAQKKSSGRRRKATATAPRSRKKSGAAVQRKRETDAEQLVFLRGEVIPLFLALFAVLLLLSNFGLCGALGTVLRDVQLGLFGGLGLVFPLLLCGIVIYRALTEDKSRALGKTVALPLSYLLILALVHLAQGEEGGNFAFLYAAKRGGGALGGLLSEALAGLLGPIGAGLILLVGLILCLSYITEKSFVSMMQRESGKVYARAKEDFDRRREARREERAQQREVLSAEIEEHLAQLEAERGKSEETEVYRYEDPVRENETPEPVRESAWENVLSAFHATRREVLAEANKEEAQEDLPREVIRTELSGDWASRSYARRENADEELPPVLRFSETEAVEEEEPVEVPDPDQYADGDPALLAALRRADEILKRDDTTATTLPHTEPPTEPTQGVAETYEEAEPERDEVFAYEEETAEDTALALAEAELREEKLAQIEKSESAEWNAEEEAPHSIEIAEADVRPALSFRREEAAPVRQQRSEPKPQATRPAAVKREHVPKQYKTPPLDLLEKGKEKRQEGDFEYRSTALKLEETLHNFGVDVKVTNFSCGPAVTRYELLPAQGVKVGRIVALADDIKLSLAAADIRIEAPIPGKSAVGIEVPNRENNTVYLRDLLESERFKKANGKLNFAVGKDIAGQTVVTDIAKMPHLLIAGATGSGKSVCINTLIMSILYRYRPEEVQLIMIDPKVVELSVYNGIPHLLIPVVTDPKKAAGALNWAVAEMTDRYRKFAETGVRDLRGYNERIRAAAASGSVAPEDLPKPLPQLVIIIDELADLMMVSKNEVEEAICRIAQLARAAGMHLVIATQRPSVNVITGLIKANIPSRIAFAVSSGIDSRTILDGVGAEKLLGKGDMLFFPQGIPKPVRVQGAFVSDQEVQKAVEYIRQEDLPLAYSEEVEDKILRSGESKETQTVDSGRDPLFFQAGRFVIEKNKASIGNLQRMFKIGFNRAARIMDQLAAAGVVGEEQGTKPRELLMSIEEFEAMEQ
ncbi:DNA translocase FtsK [Stomatobaculum sp.]